MQLNASVIKPLAGCSYAFVELVHVLSKISVSHVFIQQLNPILLSFVIERPSGGVIPTAVNRQRSRWHNLTMGFPHAAVLWSRDQGSESLHPYS